MKSGTAAAAPPRRRDYRDVHDQLLGAATELFAGGGPDAVTVSGVAERAGVSRATVHRHVGTRDELLWEVTGRLLADMGAALDQPVGPTSLGRSIDAVLTAVIADGAKARRSLASLATGRGASDGADLLDRETAMMRILAASPLGRPGIDAEVLGVINLAGMLLWASLCDRGVISGGVDRYRAEITRLLLHGAIDPEAVPPLGEEAQAPNEGRP